MFNDLLERNKNTQNPSPDQGATDFVDKYKEFHGQKVNQNNLEAISKSEIDDTAMTCAVNYIFTRDMPREKDNIEQLKEQHERELRDLKFRYELLKVNHDCKFETEKPDFFKYERGEYEKRLAKHEKKKAKADAAFENEKNKELDNLKKQHAKVLKNTTHVPLPMPTHQGERVEIAKKEGLRILDQINQSQHDRIHVEAVALSGLTEEQRIAVQGDSDLLGLMVGNKEATVSGGTYAEENKKVVTGFTENATEQQTYDAFSTIIERLQKSKNNSAAKVINPQAPFEADVFYEWKSAQNAMNLLKKHPEIEKRLQKENSDGLLHLRYINACYEMYSTFLEYKTSNGISGLNDKDLERVEGYIGGVGSFREKMKNLEAKHGFKLGNRNFNEYKEITVKSDHFAVVLQQVMKENSNLSPEQANSMAKNKILEEERNAYLKAGAEREAQKRKKEAEAKEKKNEASRAAAVKKAEDKANFEREMANNKFGDVQKRNEIRVTNTINLNQIDANFGSEYVRIHMRELKVNKLQEIAESGMNSAEVEKYALLENERYEYQDKRFRNRRFEDAYRDILQSNKSEKSKEAAIKALDKKREADDNERLSHPEKYKSNQGLVDVERAKSEAMSILGKMAEAELDRVKSERDVLELMTATQCEEVQNKQDVLAVLALSHSMDRSNSIDPGQLLDYEKKARDENGQDRETRQELAVSVMECLNNFAEKNNFKSYDGRRISREEPFHKNLFEYYKTGHHIYRIFRKDYNSLEVSLRHSNKEEYKAASNLFSQLGNLSSAYEAYVSYLQFKTTNNGLSGLSKETLAKIEGAEDYVAQMENYGIRLGVSVFKE